MKWNFNYNIPLSPIRPREIQSSDSPHCYQSYKWIDNSSERVDNRFPQYAKWECQRPNLALLTLECYRHKNSLAALFLTVKISKQPKCALKGEWLKFDKLKQNNLI